MFSIEINHSFNVEQKTWDNQIYLKLYVSMFASGLVAALGAEQTVTLLAIASFMNERGECYPTQEQIAQRIGVTRKTAATYIRKLLKFRYHNYPLITREKQRVPSKSPNEYSIYTILPIAQIAIFNGKVEPAMSKTELTMSKTATMTMGNCLPTNYNQTNKNHNNKTSAGDVGTIPTDRGGTVGTRSNDHRAGDVGELSNQETVLRHPRDVIEYFCKCYRDCYTVNYNPNWSRDVGPVKNKLLAVYTSEQIRRIIDTVFAEYEIRWKKEKYPRPSIGQLVSWLSNEALAVAEEKQERPATIPEVKKHGGRSVEAILSLLGRRREAG